MLVQFRVSEKDETLYNLIQKLDQEGEGKRGYTGEKLREMIKAFHLLSEYTGESDPYKVMMHLAQQQSPNNSKPEAVDQEVREEPVKEEKKEVKLDVDGWLSSLDNFG